MKRAVEESLSATSAGAATIDTLTTGHQLLFYNSGFSFE